MEAKILVADDEPDLLNLITQFLNRQGYEVDQAADVDSAMALMKDKTYDIILTDKNMPDGEGHQEGGMHLLKYALKHMPGTEVIMLTGYGTINTAVEAMKLGAFDYLIKPIPLKELKEKIDRVFEYRQFITAQNTIQSYKILHNKILETLENKENLPEKEIDGTLRGLGSKIDQLFGLQKEYETIIQAQVDALKEIAASVEQLKGAVPQDSPYYALVDKIEQLADRRINIDSPLTEGAAPPPPAAGPELDRLKELLASGAKVCHKLNQPLMAVSGYAELLLMDSKEDDPHRERLQNIVEQTQRMGQTTSQLMKLLKSAQSD